MTITYNAEVATIGAFGVFWKLLMRWKGSIYKLVLPDMALYIFFYYSLNLSYTYIMDEPHRKLFQQVVKYCQGMTSSIPMSFVLGFYVSIVVQRWWDQYISMPWPDALAVYVSTNIQGTDDRGRLIRRTIMRYVNLSFVYTMSQICTRVKRRFPTLNHLVEAGILTEKEQEIFEAMNKKTKHLKYWMPLVWAASIVVKARKEGRIRDDFAVKTIIDSINAFRLGLLMVLNYDWVSVPLVYTQTVTLAVYTFFIGEMMGRQFVESNGSLDLLVPIYSFLSFFFYMGWLRVAETLFNPFGDDDDDFEINWMIDRNLQVSYIIVDEMHDDHPEMVRDQYWEAVVPKELPYTEETEQYKRDPPVGSAVRIMTKSTSRFPSTGRARDSAATKRDSSVYVQLPPRDVQSASSSSSEFATKSTFPIVYPPVAHSLPGVSRRPSVGPQRKTTSDALNNEQNESLLRRSVRVIAKKLSSRVMASASATESQVTGRKSSTSLAGAGDSDAAEPSPSDAAQEPKPELLRPPPLPLYSSLHVTPETSQSSPVTTNSRTVIDRTSSGPDEKQSHRFLPGDYTFLVTPMEDEVEGSPPESSANLAPPTDDTAAGQGTPAAGPARGVGVQESALDKLLNALVNTLASASNLPGASLDPSAKPAAKEDSDKIPQNETDETPPDKQRTSQSLGMMQESNKVRIPDVSASVPSKMTPSDATFWKRTTTVCEENELKRRHDFNDIDIKDETTRKPQELSPSSSRSGSLNTSLPLRDDVALTIEDIDHLDTSHETQDSTTILSVSQTFSDLGGRLQASLQEVITGQALWPPIFSRSPSEPPPAAADDERSARKETSTRETEGDGWNFNYSDSHQSAAPSGQMSSPGAAAPSPQGSGSRERHGPPRPEEATRRHRPARKSPEPLQGAAGSGRSRSPSNDSHETTESEERAPSQASQFRQGFPDPDDAESSSSEMDFSLMPEQQRPFY